MPLTGYLKLPDIDGESRRADHEGEIDIIGTNWSMSQPATQQIGSGRVKSRAVIQPITLTKLYDAASPYIALACMQAKPFDEVVITFRKDSGDAHLDYLAITLTNVIITDYKTLAAPTDEEITELVSLAFEKIKVKYTVQADDHSKGDEHEVEYDLSAGK